MSKKIFCAQDWETPRSKPMVTATVEYAMEVADVEKNVERVVRKIESRGVDIAPTYNEWVELGFALANGLGEAGRSYFHRVSQFYPSYQVESTEDQYNKCLRSNGQGITIKTFFHLAKQAGICWVQRNSAPQNPYKNGNSPNGEMGERGNGENDTDVVETNDKIPQIPKSPNGEMGNEENELGESDIEVACKWVKRPKNLPRLPDAVFENLPPFLAEVVSLSILGDDRDVVFLGALGVLSACFENVHGEYDCHTVYPNIYLFVVADAGQGKGSLAFCRELVVPLNKALREKTMLLEQDYRAQMAIYQKEKKSCDAIMPSEPPNLMKIIPANSSASAFLKILSENNGSGLLFETEGDTLSNTLKSDFGNYSDTLRKAFHHEPINFCRRTNREYCEVDSPKLSVVLSGTPNQVRRLIPDAENGLESRFFFYRIPFVRTFRDVLSQSNTSQTKSEMFKALGERFYLTNQTFRQKEYGFVIPEHLHGIFHKTFETINDECCEEIDNGMQGIIRRVALIIYRIVMILTCVRNMYQTEDERKHKGENSLLICSNEDFHTAMLIVDTLVYHVVSVYCELSGKFTKKKAENEKVVYLSQKELVYSLLPDEFDKKEYNSIVVIQGVSVKTAEKWLNKYMSEGLLQRVEQGHYKKLTSENEPTPNH